MKIKKKESVTYVWAKIIMSRPSIPCCLPCKSSHRVLVLACGPLEPARAHAHVAWTRQRVGWISSELDSAC